MSRSALRPMTWSTCSSVTRNSGPTPTRSCDQLAERRFVPFPRAGAAQVIDDRRVHPDVIVREARHAAARFEIAIAAAHDAFRLARLECARVEHRVGVRVASSGTTSQENVKWSGRQDSNL